MMKRRVAVVGIGTVNPAGNSVEESWPNIRDGVTGIDRITKFDPDEVGVGVTLAGEVKDFDLTKRLDKREARHEARFTQFALYAAAEAIEMSGLALSEEEQNRAGVIVSCGIGGLDVIEEQYMRGVERGYDKVNPFFIPMTISNMAAARIAINHNLKGMCSCPVTACAGGTNAIGDAFHRVRDGYEDIMVCGGTEASITKLAIAGFSNMKALCQATDKNRASIPFDNERSGFVMGEGAGILVLEFMVKLWGMAQLVMHIILPARHRVVKVEQPVCHWLFRMPILHRRRLVISTPMVHLLISMIPVKRRQFIRYLENIPVQLWFHLQRVLPVIFWVAPVV